MALIINEHGEFVDVDPPDHDARRAKVYKSCVDVDASMFREKMNQLREKKEKKRAEKHAFTRVCPWCHEEFATTVLNKNYCSTAHQRADYNKKRREANAARREARS